MKNFSHKFREYQNTLFISNSFFLFSWKSCRLWDNVQNWDTARQASNENIIRRMHFPC